MRKSVLFFCLCIFLISAVCFAEESNNFRPGSEPSGFKGVKWGTDITQLAGMELVRKEQIFADFPSPHLNLRNNPFDIYTKRNEVLKIGEIALDRIEYGFLHGKLLCVVLVTKGEENSKKLKSYAFEQYGDKANVVILVPKEYQWRNNSVEVRLELDEGADASIADYYTPQSEGVLVLMSWDTYKRTADWEGKKEYELIDKIMRKK